MNSHGAFKSLHVDFADYHLAKFEQLGDLSAGRATRKVILTFLQDVDYRDHVEIRLDFFLPELPVYTKPHGYNELEYRVYNTNFEWSSTCGWCGSSAVRKGPSSPSLGEARSPALQW